MPDRDQTAQHFLDLIKKSRRGKLKIYIGMSAGVGKTIVQQAEERQITTICMGKPHFSLIKIILATNVFNELLKKLSSSQIDLVILS